MENLKTRTITALGWSGAAQVVRQIMQFTISVILARMLSPQDFGMIGMIVVFTGFAAIFSELGMGAALIQKLDLSEHHLNSVFWVNIVVGILLTGIVVGVAPFIASFYDEPSIRLITMVIASSFFIGSLGVVQNSLLNKKMDFRRLAQVEITAVSLAGLVAIIMAIKGFGIWSLVAQSLFFTSISVVMMWSLSAWRPTLSFNTNALKELLGFSSNLLGFNIFNYWSRNIDNLMIGKFIGSSALGIYTRSYSLMMLPLTQISSVVSRVMFPSLSTIQDDLKRVKQIYLRSTQTIALVTFPVMMGLLVVAEPFIITIYGLKWLKVITILQILCPVGMVQSIGTTVGWIYTSQGRTDLMFKWGIFAGIVRGVSFAIGLHWGVIGVAAAYCLSSYAILWYPGWTIAGRLINLSFSEMLKNLSGPFCSAIGMAAGIYVLGLLLPVYLPHWAYLAVQVPLGVVMYLLLIHTFRLKAYIELKILLREQWRLRFAKTSYTTR